MSAHSRRGLPGARELAARVLVRVDRDRAYASRALDAELGRYPQIEPRERALATELVYGTLRTRAALEKRLQSRAPRGLARLDSWVMAHLLLSAYQLLILERIPNFAAVDAAVTAIGENRGARLAGFANAVLRALASSPERLTLADAAWQSVPKWLAERLEQALGAEEARALVGTPGPEALAVRPVGPGPWPDWLEQAERSALVPGARLLRSLGDPRKLPGYHQGSFVVQEQGSQLVALAVGARSGERVLDACAGHGQKASLLAEAVGPGGQLWVADRYPEKLRALVEEFRRLRLPLPRAAPVDWTVGTGTVESGFDRVLVDAPCTGTGTLRRRPEILSRLKPEDPRRLGELAEAILRRAASLARPGGRVVFSVCSVLPDEGEQVVARVARDLECVPFDAPALAALSETAGGEHGRTSFRLLPARDGTDGYFVASLRVPD